MLTRVSQWYQQDFNQKMHGKQGEEKLGVVQFDKAKPFY